MLRSAKRVSKHEWGSATAFVTLPAPIKHYACTTSFLLV